MARVTEQLVRELRGRGARRSLTAEQQREHGEARKRDKAMRMRQTAALCSRMGHHETSIALLKLSLEVLALKVRAPLDADVVERAIFAALAVQKQGAGSAFAAAREGVVGGDAAAIQMSEAELDREVRWRLQACMLTDGLMQPWPATLVVMLRATPAAHQGVCWVAFAALCKALTSGSPFCVGARVLAHIYDASQMRHRWHTATIAAMLQAGRFDVMLEGRVERALPRSHVLSPSVGGPGGVLREACKVGAVEVVEAMLEHGISPHESDYDATSPLHRAAEEGHVEARPASIELAIPSCSRARSLPLREIDASHARCRSARCSSGTAPTRGWSTGDNTRVG
jgi:hypothetical protein